MFKRLGNFFKNLVKRNRDEVKSQVEVEKTGIKARVDNIVNAYKKFVEDANKIDGDIK